MDITVRLLQQLIREELTKSDKDEIRSMVRGEFDKEVKAKLDKAVSKEVEAVLKDKATEQQMADISKKIIKKLYKDLSLHHPYIIDRIKI